MSAEKTAKVRDRRKPGWFRMDDELIEVYGPKVGVHGIAVYAAICRHADKEESSHPSLRTLCERLKIGRKKLLDTLALLEKEGLISVERGDRANVSVYTLLDVPKAAKGGSDENHAPAEGGSNQNQGWFRPEPQGGSDENRNQTQVEPNTPNQKEGRAREAPLPDDTTAACLLVLKNVKGLGKDYGELAVLLGELRREFPAVDAVSVCKEYELYHRRPPRPTRNHALKLRRFFVTAATPKGNGKPPGKARGDPANTDEASARRQEGYEWLFAK